MKGKTLVILVAVLLAVAGLSVLRARRQPAPVRGGPRGGGTALVAFDVNAVAAIEVRSGGRTATVVRADGPWAVPSLFGYPADYDKVVESLRKLAEAKVGQVVPGGTDFLADFGLLAPTSAGGTNEAGTLTFRDAAGKPLGVVQLGRSRMPRSDSPYGGYPDGQYVRVGDGPVLLLAQAPGDFPAEGENWVKKQLASVSSTDATLVSAEVSNSAYRLTVKGYDDFALDGKLAADEELDKDNARRAAGALSYLSFSAVADPAKPDAELGLEKPAVFALEARDGFAYRVLLGGKPEGRDGRHARFSVEYRKPAAPAAPPAPAAGADTNAAAQAKADHERDLKKWQDDTAAAEKRLAEEKARFGKWTYVVSDYAAESMLLPRERLVKKIEKKPEPPAATNAAPSAAEAPATNAAAPAPSASAPAPATNAAPAGVAPAP
jgi:hypothetical protein